MMFIEELWRYPVKSLAGERLDRIEVERFGLKGDRIVHIRKADHRLITARTHPKLLGLKATLGANDQPLISGQAWDSSEALNLIREASGADAELAYYGGPERFDVLPLLVATDGAIKVFGHDSRRLRPNIVVGGVKALEERTWPGQLLRIGTVLIGIQDLRARCVMTTYDPDSIEQNPRILKEIVAKFDGELALNCFVLREGVIRLGDRVELLRTADFDPSRVTNTHGCFPPSVLNEGSNQRNSVSRTLSRSEQYRFQTGLLAIIGPNANRLLRGTLAVTQTGELNYEKATRCLDDRPWAFRRGDKTSGTRQDAGHQSFTRQNVRQQNVKRQNVE